MQYIWRRTLWLLRQEENCIHCANISINIISSVRSVSQAPKKFCICLKKENLTNDRVQEEKKIWGWFVNNSPRPQPLCCRSREGKQTADWDETRWQVSDERNESLRVSEILWWQQDTWARRKNRSSHAGCKKLHHTASAFTKQSQTDSHTADRLWETDENVDKSFWGCHRFESHNRFPWTTLQVKVHLMPPSRFPEVPLTWCWENTYSFSMMHCFVFH